MKSANKTEKEKVMKEKVMTPEKLRKIQLKREKEIKKWEKEKARPRKNTYIIYLIFKFIRWSITNFFFILN